MFDSVNRGRRRPARRKGPTCQPSTLRKPFGAIPGYAPPASQRGTLHRGTWTSKCSPGYSRSRCSRQLCIARFMASSLDELLTIVEASIGEPIAQVLFIAVGEVRANALDADAAVAVDLELKLPLRT